MPTHQRLRGAQLVCTVVHHAKQHPGPDEDLSQHRSRQLLQSTIQLPVTKQASFARGTFIVLFTAWTASTRHFCASMAKVLLHLKLEMRLCPRLFVSKACACLELTRARIVENRGSGLWHGMSCPLSHALQYLRILLTKPVVPTDRFHWLCFTAHNSDVIPPSSLFRDDEPEVSNPVDPRTQVLWANMDAWREETAPHWGEGLRTPDLQ